MLKSDTGLLYLSFPSAITDPPTYVRACFGYGQRSSQAGSSWRDDSDLQTHTRCTTGMPLREGWNEFNYDSCASLILMAFDWPSSPAAQSVSRLLVFALNASCCGPNVNGSRNKPIQQGERKRQRARCVFCILFHRLAIKYIVYSIAEADSFKQVKLIRWLSSFRQRRRKRGEWCLVNVCYAWRCAS